MLTYAQKSTPVRQTGGGKGEANTTEDASGTSRGTGTAGKPAKRVRTSVATPAAGGNTVKAIDPAEFDRIIAMVRKQLFNSSDSVPKQQYLELQQENVRLAKESKQAQDLAASKQAALDEYTSLLSRMNAVNKPM
ncbi:g5014 [Coccomyxa viridis]|uniref:G5014 protein n=1 Tax=Coccomyxa viridis TaxID=1274662 RepID=A0ABP1FUL6_9CHLO